MAKFTDSLRGYSHPIHVRDNFVCRYCGADGKQSFEIWITFTSEHLLPKGHPKRDDEKYIVTACQFCNTSDNRYFDYAEKRGLTFDNKTPEQLVEQRKPFVEKTRQEYRNFWEEHINSLT